MITVRMAIMGMVLQKITGGMDGSIHLGKQTEKIKYNKIACRR